MVTIADEEHGPLLVQAPARASRRWAWTAGGALALVAVLGVAGAGIFSQEKSVTKVSSVQLASALQEKLLIQPGQRPDDFVVVKANKFVEKLKDFIANGVLDNIEKDIKALLTTSQDFWPADHGHYGGLFVRLAWHCAGSYQIRYGRGGCDGGRIRFFPERDWDDNTNLDKALRLLTPIKEKYGVGLSWGDLIAFTGTVALQDMGFPTLGFCWGRVDDPDGTASEGMGPPGPLIYVNPEGPDGCPDPEGSAAQIREIFGGMGMNDSETVALIAGGHSIGKAHGACPAGAGPSPSEDPANPWPGKCGTGKGNDTYTAGFEGAWTDFPKTFTNQFFQDLLKYDWEVYEGPGGKHQWRVPHRPDISLFRFTTDIALKTDPEYLKLAKAWAQDFDAFKTAFAHAWYKLTTRDMGPKSRCLGTKVPKAEPFQDPLPPPPTPLTDTELTNVRTAIKSILHTSNPVLPADTYNGAPYYGALFVRLAWRCADTFRQSDYLGGCNGARLRFSPQKDWPENADLDKTLLVLKPIKDQFPISWADLIALAGTVALEEAGEAGQVSLPFCQGRSDAEKAGASDIYLLPNVSAWTECSDVMKSYIKAKGFSLKEWTVLMGGGHSLGKMHEGRSGYTGSWTATPTLLSNSYFVNLLQETWELYTVPGTKKEQYKAHGKELYMLKSDLIFLFDPELKAIVEDYAADERWFFQDFQAAWRKLMNIDLFDGPTGSTCNVAAPS